MHYCFENLILLVRDDCCDLGRVYLLTVLRVLPIVLKEGSRCRVAFYMQELHGVSISPSFTTFTEQVVR